MPIKNITEIENKSFPEIKPVKEIMPIYLNVITENVPNRNGFVWLISGSGGSGKSSMALNFFRNNYLYRGHFDNIFYFCPSSSFESVENHPFKRNEENINVYHDLSKESLKDIYDLLEAKKLAYTEYLEKQNKITKKKYKKNNKQIGFLEEENENENNEEVFLEYSCLFIDDMADTFKNKDLQPILNKILIKTRHLCLAVIITTQQLKYVPLRVRSQITNLTLFKTKNMDEFFDIAREYFNMNREDALTLFNYVFSENYSHLDVDTVGNKYYKNFNLLEF